MTTKYARLLAAATASLALAGGLAACGDDDTAANNKNNNGMMGNAATTAPSSAASADGATVDAAFLRQMIPHHQLAVEMAQIAKKRAKHDELKVLATDIIAAQETEITEMNMLAKELGTSTDGATGQMAADAKILGLPMSQMGMSMKASSLEGADPFDQAFIDEMIPHHTGAIAMAKAELKSGSDARVKKLASGIVAAQTKEIAEMQAWRKDWYGDAAGTTSGHMNGDEHGDMPGM